MRRRPSPVVLGPAALALTFLLLPLVGLVARAPWASLGEHLGTPAIGRAIWLSVVTSVAATVLSLLLGAPLAWLLARWHFPGKPLVRAVALGPLVLPPVVGGVALLTAFGRRGLVGQWLERWAGVSLPFTTAGAVVAATFVALPFLVLALEGGLRGLDRRFEEVAGTLGARPLTRLRRVVLPLVAPSLAAGAVLSWARALGEFGATITFAGNLPGRTQTMPLAAFLALETDPQEAIVLSLVLLGSSLAVLVALRDRWFPAR